MSPEDMNELLFSPFDLALGEDTRERIRTQVEHYDYYDGKQHVNQNGELVRASELETPAGLDYEPTRYSTNYFKAIIDRKAKWQMAGKHGISVPKKVIDDPVEATAPDYEPSPEQQRADEIDEGMEKIIYQLWEENRMRQKLLPAARDRLIANRVVCKIAFNPNTGKLKWVFRPDTEYIPIYSDDDFEEQIGAHFLRQKLVEEDGEEAEAIQKQTFMLEGEGDSRQCYIEEAVYLMDDLSLYEQIQPKQTMGIDFIPVVEFSVNDLLGEFSGRSEVSDLREQNDILNQMNEDAIDSMKFEMFPITAFVDVAEGTAEQAQIAPGAAIEMKGGAEGTKPDVKKLESRFTWKEAFKDQYMRVKAAMHEVSNLPQVVPQEMNFGGLNGETLQILFHDIITDTEEHWLTWEAGFKELHEKSIKYLQARIGEPKFAYDKEILRNIEDYRTEINFVLPLPDNRKELVELLGAEMSYMLESQSGAMERLGVEDVQTKKQEIANEQTQMQAEQDPYAGEGLGEEDVPVEGKIAEGAPEEILAEYEVGEEFIDPKTGEVSEICQQCGGSGQIRNPATGNQIICPNCRGDGITQVRKR